MIDFLKESKGIKHELINLRRDIHMHPELGYEEVRTSNLIKKFLINEGIQCESIAGTGVVGVIKCGSGEGKVIGLRADIDALPIIDKKNCCYKSKINGKMHACGHDAHTTILLGVAKIINKYKDKFNGTVKLMFEPAEETTGGAQIMIHEGVLENPKVDGIIGLHVSEDVDCGKIQIKEEMVNAASNPIYIKIKGKGGHGANPSVTVDPIVISAQVIMGLQQIVSREVSPLHPVVLTIGDVHGGSAPNVIPHEVNLSGIIRTITKEDREYVVNRVNEIVNGISRSFRADADICIEEGYPCLYNDKQMTCRLRRVAENVIGTDNVLIKEYPSMGVESFAYFANNRPAVFYYLGTKNVNKNTDKPAHGNYFDIDEDAIPIGVALQCSFIYDYLTRD